jgi:hypothetical protein
MRYADFDNEYEAHNLLDHLNRNTCGIARMTEIGGGRWRVQADVTPEVFDMALSECHSAPTFVF